MTSIIHIQNGRKAFGKRQIFDHLQLSITRPGLYVISGPSGSGKSTLLNIIAGQESLSDGKLEVKGKIAMIFQNYELIDELSIEDNIFFKKKLDRKDRELLKRLGIIDFLHHTPKELSFGQRQRVGIARALAQAPDIVLSDEPTESLDVANKHIVMQMLKEYSRHHIVIVVSHDQTLIERYHDVIYTFKDDTLKKVKDDLTARPFHRAGKIKRDIATMIFKMTIKKTIIIGFVLVILVSLLWALYSYKKQIFDISSTTNAICADYIYIEKDDALEDIRIDFSSNAKIILDIPYANIENVRQRIDAYPYHETEGVDFIKGRSPGAKEVIVNDLYKDIAIGDKITLEIATSEKVIEYNVEVVGIIREKDAMYRAIYYDNDAIFADLDKVVMRSQDGEDITVSDAILNSPSRFESNVGYLTISLGNYDDNPYVKTPVYDMRMIAHTDSGIYKLIFEVILSICGLFLVVFVYIFERKDVSSFLYQAAIMDGMGIDIKKMRIIYLLDKFLVMSLFIVATYISAYLIKREIFFHVNYTDSEWLIFIFCLLALYLFYIVVLIVNLNLKHQNMALTLKKRVK